MRIIIFLAILGLTLAAYTPSWESLDKRPLPEWYDKAKIGIFLHWGVFSVPSYGSEWFWWSWQGDKSAGHIDFVRKHYAPEFTYAEFAKELRAEFFDPKEWADLFAKSGAKYVVLTSKHHEGYTMWPSKYSFNWNSMDVGPRRDLVGDLASAVRDKNLHFGLYHSLLEWFHPLYLQDKANNFTTSTFVDTKIMPEMKELVSKYKPEVLWSDGNWESPDTYWKSTEFLAWLYNDSPVRDVIVTNDRWGSNTQCKHGDFWTCADRYNPGHLQEKKWENAMTIDKQSWGYRRTANIADFLSVHELLVQLAQTISYGGNLLINVGPTKEGTIAPIFQERLLGLGKWLSINGEAIYESKPYTVQIDTATKEVYYTSKGRDVYAIVLNWPENEKLYLGALNNVFSDNKTSVILLGNPGKLTWRVATSTVTIIDFPSRTKVISENAWVLKISPA